MKLVKIIKICLNGTYSTVSISKSLCNAIPIQNGLKQGDASLPLIVVFALAYSVREVQGNR
jgi:hypothetical protein